MGIVATPLYHLECNGPAPTPLHAHCTSTSDGGWDLEQVELQAIGEGWSVQGTKRFCRKHTAAETGAAAVKQARKPKAPAPVEEHQG